MSLVGLVLAALVGLSLGLLGGGGSILTVPILVYVLGYGPKEAIAMSLAIVGVTSLFGAASHWRAGNVNVKVAGLFALVAMAGTFLGARLAVFVSGAVQLTLFAAVMLAAAYFMLRPRRPAPGLRADESATDSREKMPIQQIALQGLGVGLLTGLVGVGGGFLIVPTLVLLARVPIRQAIGTSLLVIALNSAAGFAGYLGQVDVHPDTLLTFIAAAAAGILTGTFMVRYVSAGALRRSFAVFLVAMGLFILYRNGVALFVS